MRKRNERTNDWKQNIYEFSWQNSKTKHDYFFWWIFLLFEFHSLLLSVRVCVSVFSSARFSLVESLLEVLCDKISESKLQRILK